MTNIKTGFRAFLNVILLVLVFCIPGSGVVFAWFYIDRKNFMQVLTGKRWLISYTLELRRRYAFGES